MDRKAAVFIMAVAVVAALGLLIALLPVPSHESHEFEFACGHTPAHTAQTLQRMQELTNKQECSRWRVSTKVP